MDYFLKSSFFYLLLLALPATQIRAHNVNIDKSAIYAALAGKDIKQVDAIIVALQASNLPEKSAYEGALLMKKAGLAGKPKEKLSLFKSGRSKLEAAIKNDPANVEYHFLRLIIQEKAPKILNYQHEKKADAELIKTSFKKLSTDIQQVIRDYSKNSDILKPTDF